MKTLLVAVRAEGPVQLIAWLASASWWQMVEGVPTLAPEKVQSKADAIAIIYPALVGFGTEGMYVHNKPKNRASDKAPSVRVVPDCEAHHHTKCILFAVDDDVVLKPADHSKQTASATHQ